MTIKELIDRLRGFYVESIDTFIELNLFWTHMKHPFTNSEDDKILLNELMDKSNNNQYTSAIKVLK